MESGICQNGGRTSRDDGVVTQSRRSALAITVLGLFVLWALVFDPVAGAKLPAPPPPLQAPPPQLITTFPALPRIVTVQRGDTLMSLLQGAGIAATPAQAAIDVLKRRFDPRDLKIGQEIALGLDETGLRELRLTPDLQHSLRLLRGDDGRYDLATLPRDLTRVTTRIDGAISSSLFETASDVGMPQAVLAAFVGAFSYDVDFQREIQPGDSFEVLYEQLVDTATGKRVGTGDLIYAAIKMSGHLLQLYRYTPPGGEPS